MSTCCCCLPTPLTCLIIGVFFTFLALYDLICVYETLTHALDDELSTLGVLAAIHILQVVVGVCIVIAILRQLPYLLRGCSFVVGASGIVYFVRVLFIESRTATSTVVWASLVIAIYIYLASLLCASAGIMEMMQADEPNVIWYASYNPSTAAQESPQEPLMQRLGPNGPVNWFVLVPPTRFPPQRPSTTGNGEAATAAAPASPAAQPAPATP